ERSDTVARDRELRAARVVEPHEHGGFSTTEELADARDANQRGAVDAEEVGGEPRLELADGFVHDPLSVGRDGERELGLCDEMRDLSELDEHNTVTEA